MIPKTFHWVWLGEGAIPDRDRAWMQSWRAHHPGWVCIVWAEHPGSVSLDGFETRPLPSLCNQKFYNDIEQWVDGRAVVAARSDIARYEIVAVQGGVYLDTDVECFQPIDDLLAGVRLFVADEWGGAPGNYCFGAMPNHPALHAVLRELPGHINRTGKANAVAVTGPNYFNPQLRKYSSDLVIFHHAFFNPLCADDDPQQVQVWPAVSRANHHFDGKWYDRTKRTPAAEFLRTEAK